MISILKSLIPDFSHLEESLFKVGDITLGHQCVLVLKSGYPFAGGTDVNPEIARRICAAEAIERSYVARLKENEPRLTSCGFAAGFEEKPTIFRAVCEAVERWAWSKWIDEGCSLARANPEYAGPLEDYFASCFSEVFAFSGSIGSDSTLWPAFMDKNLELYVTIGHVDGGIFPGSRVTTGVDRRWDHPILEAWRHRMIFLNELKASEPKNIFDRRIKNFGLNGDDQLQKILEVKEKPWPKVSLSVLQEVASRDGYFVWRAYCHDYLGWEQGDGNRFIY